MTNSALKNLRMKHSLEVHNKEETIKQETIEHIRKIPNYMLLKNDIELILYVCNIVENTAKSVDNKKPDKKELVMTIMTLAFSLQKAEQEVVEKAIDFLHNNKKIKKMSFMKQIGYAVADWAIRRVL